MHFLLGFGPKFLCLCPLGISGAVPRASGGSFRLGVDWVEAWGQPEAAREQPGSSLEQPGAAWGSLGAAREQPGAAWGSPGGPREHFH